MLTIIKANGPASAADIDAAEHAIGASLPQQYRDFLATIGGGQTGDLDVPGAGGDGVLMEICGTDALVRRNVTSGRGGFAANIPGHYVIIGYGAGGAPCVRVRNGDEGSIWWADFENAGGLEDEAPTEDIMIRLADDFDGFLNLFE